MICPRCGTEMPDGAKFCATCGLDLLQHGNEENTLVSSSPNEIGGFEADQHDRKASSKVSYCRRCGYSISFFGNKKLKDGWLCKECMNELGFSKDDPIFTTVGTYEMMLAAAKVKNPLALETPIGKRESTNFILPEPISTIRGVRQILDEDYLVEKPNIKLDNGEKCYYSGTLTMTTKALKTTVKGGSTYTGLSFNLGGGIRYSVGGRTPSKTKTKQVKKSSTVKFCLTTDNMVIAENSELLVMPYNRIREVRWSIKSFDVTYGNDKATFSTLILPVDKIELIYNLARFAQEEDKVFLKEQKKAQRTKQRKSTTKKESVGKDPITQIREYKQLMDEGIITEEEFEKKKAELLKL